MAMEYFQVYFTILVGIMSIMLSFVCTLQFSEACVMFRAFILYSKTVKLIGGGYYQRLSFMDRAAMWYLARQCELSYERLPQGGWVVHEFNWNMHK